MPTEVRLILEVLRLTYTVCYLYPQNYIWYDLAMLGTPSMSHRYFHLGNARHTHPSGLQFQRLYRRMKFGENILLLIVLKNQFHRDIKISSKANINWIFRCITCDTLRKCWTSTCCTLWLQAGGKWQILRIIIDLYIVCVENELHTKTHHFQKHSIVSTLAKCTLLCLYASWR